jgi:hypothetical protein
MTSFNIDNPLVGLEQSGLIGVTLDDNASPAANILYSSLKSGGGGGSSNPATATSLGTIQLAGVLTGTATSPQLAAGSVGASQLAPGAVNASSIAPGSITGSSLAPGSITSTQLAPGSVGSAQLAPGSVGSSQLANGAVGAAQIANNAIGAAQIANGAIGPMQLAPLSGPSELIGSNGSNPNATNITLGPSLQINPAGVMSVNPSAVTVAPSTTTSLGTIQLAGVLTGTATSPQLAPGSVGALQLAPGAVTASSIAPGSISGASLAPGSITSTQLAPGSVSTTQLANLSAPSELIGSNGLTSAATNITLGSSLSISPGGVLSVAPGAVPPATSSALGTIQLAGALSGSATVPTLASGSVGAPQIVAGSVGTTQLANNSVGTTQLALLSGPSELIGSNSVSSAATNISVGNGLSINSSGVLAVTPGAVPAATSASLGTIQLAGALTGIATAPALAANSVGSSQISSGAVGTTQLGPNVVGLGQLAPLSSTSELIGSNSLNTTATNISLGNSLTISPTGVLSVNPSTAVPAATSSSLGTIQLAGALSGTATAPTLATGSVGATQVIPGSIGATQLGANVVGNGQLAALSGTSELIGSSNTSTAATNIILGSGLSITGNTLNSTLGTVPVPVASGGTGLTTITSGDILIGNGTGPITVAPSIPATKVTPMLVGMVNGVSPSSAGGNVTVVLGNVTTGTLAALPAPLPNGSIYVVSGDPTPSNNGRTFISTGSTWNEVTNNIATTDARYVQLAGSTMNANANLVFPSTGHVTLNQTTFSPTDAVTAAYVASQIASGSTPAATTSSLGTIQLAGVLTGTATAPAIASGVITQSNMAANSIGAPQIIPGSVGATQLGANVVGNGQLAALSATSELIGSNSSSQAATNISLGTGLSMTGSVLSVNSSTAVPSATSSSLGTIQLAGALTGAATAPTLANGSVGSSQIIAGSVGATQLGANVVGTGQLAPLSSTSQLYGSNGTSQAATNITLGNSLTISPGGVMSVNAANAVPAATPSTLGTIQLAGALSGSATAPTLANGSVGSSQIIAGSVGAIQLGANVVGTGQLAPLSSTSQLYGSNGTSQAATNITLGNGLSINPAGVLAVTPGAVPSATTASLGTIQLAGALTGTATAPALAANSVGSSQISSGAVGATQIANGAVGATQLGPNVVGTGQLAPLPGTSQLYGSNSASQNATNITLGSGLVISSGGVLSATAVAPAPATATTLGTIQLAGSLSGTATAPTIANNAIGTAQMANNAIGSAQLANGAVGLTQLATLPSTSELIGSSSASTTASAITLGTGLTMSAGGQLNLNLTGVTIPSATASIIGGIQMLGDLTGSVATAPTVAPGAISLIKMANLGGNSQLIGSSSTSSAPADITLGPSMSMTASQLNSAISFLSSVNPNVTAPTDRPTTSNVFYVGTDGSGWIWNGTTYILATQASTLQVKQSTAVFNFNSLTYVAQLTDLNVTVNPGQRVSISYTLNMQFQNQNYAPIFGWLGVASTDTFQASCIGMYYSTGDYSTIYASTANNNITIASPKLAAVSGILSYGSVPSGNYGSIAYPAFIKAYYTNNGSTTTTLILQARRTGGNNIAIAGGIVEWTYY